MEIDVCSTLKRYGVFVRYIISGFSSVMVQFGLLALLVEQLHFGPLISSGIAFVISCLVNYLMLYYWTFKARTNHVIATLKYSMVTLFGLLINLMIFSFLMDQLHLWYLISQTFATLFVSLITYIINRSFTFTSC